jgi:hypothetical protein
MSIGMNGILITGMTYPVQFGVWADVHGTSKYCILFIFEGIIPTYM